MKEHTPGPWVDDGDCDVTDRNDDLIARTDATRAANDPTALADARLIAAAPDMEKALELFETWDNGVRDKGVSFRQVREALRAALAKAKGE